MPNLTRSVLGSGVIKSGGASFTGGSASTFGITGITSAPVLSRLAAIRALLKTMGISDISKLGTLSISGNVLVQGGLTTPPPVVTGGGVVGGGVVGAVGVGGFLGARAVAVPAAPKPADATPPVSFSGARQLSALADGAMRVRSLAGTATTLPATRLPQFEHHSLPLSIFDAIWVATTINLADGTSVILVPPGAANLLILAQKIVIGNGVNFTWQRQPPSWQAAQPDASPGQTASAPVAPAAQTGGHATGTNGTPGSSFSATPGGTGLFGAPGPDIEIWTLDISGSLNLDLAGQDGQPGGRGQDGQPGGPGGTGGPSDSGFWCKFGPGSGGTGGAGGPGAAGGNGGNGGDGGNLAIFAPLAFSDSVLAGLILDTDAGAGGGSGAGGAAGAGGAGGALGPWANAACKALGRGTSSTPGGPGAAGSAGSAGTPGHAGNRGTLNNADLFNTITAADFNREFTAPHIASLSAFFGSVGDAITLNGGNLQSTDVVMVANTPATTTVSSDTTAAFVVPDLPGGATQVVVQRADASEVSNPASFTVLPQIASVTSDRTKGGAILWGSNATIVGNGFSDACRVQINGVDTPCVFRDQHTITLRFSRPGGDPLAAAGATDPFATTATVKVLLPFVLPAGASESSVTVAVAICRIAALGDSIIWGQGLSPAPPAMKFVDLVRDAVSSHLGDIDTFVDMMAHSGATLGPSGGAPAASGEVPDAVPTIPAQLAALAAIANPFDVDVMIVDGGINDVGVATILNPQTATAALTAATTTACLTAMTKFLTTAASKFPNAQIVVTGYYPILSSSSDPVLISLLVSPIIDFVFPGLGLLFSAIEISNILSNCATFFTLSSGFLTSAVAAANAAAITAGVPAPAGLLSAPGMPRIVFADPPFTNDNAALAPSSWLFGINIDGSPQDPVAATRAAACAVAFPGGGTGRVFCNDASVGHPNQIGATQYSQVIQDKLLGTLCTFACAGGTFNSATTGPVPVPPFAGSLVVNETAGRLIIPTPWAVPPFGALTAPAVLTQTGPATFTTGPLRGSTQALTVPVTISSSVALGPISGGISGSAGLTTGGPVTAGGLPPVTGAGLPASAAGTVTFVMAGILSVNTFLGPSIPFTLVLPGALAPVPA